MANWTELGESLSEVQSLLVCREQHHSGGAQAGHAERRFGQVQAAADVNALCTGLSPRGHPTRAQKLTLLVGRGPREERDPAAVHVTSSQ